MPDPQQPTGHPLLLGVTESSPPEPPRHRQSWADVPWRTIIATVAIVVATYLLMQVVLMTVRIITWVAIAAFFALVLAPAVRWVEPRVRGRRGLATGIVVFATLAAVIGLLSLFLLPVRTQLIAVITDLPGTVEDAANGRGTIGRLVTKLHLNNYVQDHEAQLQRAAERLSGSSFQFATAFARGVIAFITITVLAFLFLSQATAMGKAVTNLIPMRRREPIKRIAADASQAISSYMVGNLLISLIAGVTAFICLFALGIPNAIVLALWVAFADLIPLVGATLGAAVASLAGFFHSSTAGVISVIFFVIYQQVENSVLYPAIMARRVKISPLVVLLSVLLGVEMFGFLGALLAVPVSGAIGVAMKAVGHEIRREGLVLPVEEPATDAT